MPLNALGDSVVLDTYNLPIKGSVRVSLVNTLPGKQTVGKSTRADSVLADEWVQEDWRGGMLVNQLDETADLDKFWISTAATWYRRFMTLPPEVVSCGYPALGLGNIQHVIEFKPDNCNYVLVYATDSPSETHTILFKVDYVPATEVWTFTNIGTFNDPITSWIVFNQTLYLAQGNIGYRYTATPSTWGSWTLKDGGADATLKTSYFCWMDSVIESTGTFGKLYKISPAGLITASADGLTWVSTVGGTVPTDFTVTGLVQFRNQNDDPTLFVQTTEGLLAVDVANKVIFRTDLQLLHGTDTGRDAAVWTDGYLYFPDGLSLWKYPKGGQITNQGLDRNDGLPTYVRGHITALVRTPNYLLAMIDANDALVIRVESDFLGAEWGTFTVPTSGGFSMIALFNGSGWHCLYLSTSTQRTVGDGVLSTRYDNQRRLIFPEGRELKSIYLPEGNYDPRVDANARFAATAFHDSGWFDSGQAEILKVSTSISLRGMNITSSEVIDVYYATDDKEAFTLLGSLSASTIDSYGRVNLLFNQGKGIAWYTLRLRFQFRRGSDRKKSPVLLFFDVKTKKHFAPVHSHTIVVDGSRLDGLQNVWRAIKALERNPLLVPFRFRTEEGTDEQANVKVAGVTGLRSTGQDETSTFTVTLIELEPAAA